MDADPVGRRVGVVGGGWAGLAAAVEATARGHRVTLFEMAPEPGGRARAVAVEGLALDNGQHILIGAYTATLALMRRVGVDPGAVLERTPLALTDARGRGLRLSSGAPIWAFVRGVLAQRDWVLADRLSLLGAALGWAGRRFRCPPGWTVGDLSHGLPAAVRRELIDPLCVAALNTAAEQASASVFLRVLRDALFSGAGSADLLLPRVDLGSLLPRPAARWLVDHGARLLMTRRVAEIAAAAQGWRIDGEPFDAVVLAATSAEAARLVGPVASEWSAKAAQLHYEPIVTVYTHAAGASLPAPMIALAGGAAAPAQFAFDRGQLSGFPGVLAWVASGARDWVDRGADATAAATLQQCRDAFSAPWARTQTVLRVIAEKRATFRCTPGLERPSMSIARGLFAAGDYVDGPYPATLEGAVRSGVEAASAIDGLDDRRSFQGAGSRSWLP